MLVAAYAPTSCRRNREERERFYRDLGRVTGQRPRDSTVVVGGDFNETLGDTMDGLTKLCNDCGLVDVHNNRHGTDNPHFQHACQRE